MGWKHHPTYQDLRNSDIRVWRHSCIFFCLGTSPVSGTNSCRPGPGTIGSGKEKESRSDVKKTKNSAATRTFPPVSRIVSPRQTILELPSLQIAWKSGGIYPVETVLWPLSCWVWEQNTLMKALNSTLHAFIYPIVKNKCSECHSNSPSDHYSEDSSFLLLDKSCKVHSLVWWKRTWQSIWCFPKLHSLSINC